MLTMEGRELRADTRTLKATFENGRLVSLVRKTDGKLLVRAAPGGAAPLQLIYSARESAPLGGQQGDRVTCLPINQYCAELRFEAWNGDGVLLVSEDRESGALIVEPSAYASRPGLRAVRWLVDGIQPELDLVAPFFQGVRLAMEDPLVHDTRWHWPHLWEAGLAILQGESGGLSIACRDRHCRYKALQVGAPENARCLGLDTEAYGPIDANLSSGGLAWRVNVHDGEWQVPAAEYRDWLARAHDMDGVERPDWVRKLRLAVSWCPVDTSVLEALAARFVPGEVLLHVPGWRSDPYDQGYPTFAPSPQGEAFIRRAQQMGFRTMPHFNAIDMDPTHPVHTSVRDFCYRALETKRIEGWTWHAGRVEPVMESNAGRLRHRDKNTMVKIHPGLAMWRSILAEQIASAVRTLELRSVFLDVALCTWNLHNCLVDNQTPTEGMNRLLSQIAALGPGLAIGGEGRNEMTMQQLSFGQVHLFKSWQDSIAGLDRTDRAPVGELLFGRYCRSFGYTNLDGHDDVSALRMDVHRRLGAIPTITVGSARQIAEPNAAMAALLSGA